MSSHIVFEYVIKDKRGRVRKKGVIKGHSFVENYWKLVSMVVCGQDSTGVTDVNGNSKNINLIDIASDTTEPLSFTVIADEGIDAYGLVVGSGTDAVKMTDYKLASKISHSDTGLYYLGMSYSEEVTVPDTKDVAYFEVYREFENRSTDTDVVIYEVGLIYKAKASTGETIYVLIAREVLPEEEKITLKPGELLALKAKIQNKAIEET